MALLFGVHENVDPAVTLARLGGNATRVFTGGVIAPRDLIKAATAVCGPSWAAGQTAVWSFKPRPDAVSNGTWQPYMSELGEFLAANPAKRTVIVIWHEPENDVPAWFAGPAAFVRLFDTVAGWLRAAHPQITIAHAALGYRYADNVDITDAVAPRWRTSADVHCVDIYSGRSNKPDTILPELSGYRRWRSLVAGTSRWGVTERGWTITKSGDSALRVATMAREAAWLASLGEQAPEIYLGWNTGGTEGDTGLIFDAGAEKIAQTINAQYAALSMTRTAAAATAAAAATGTAAGAAAPGAPAPQNRTVVCPLCAGSGRYSFTV